MEIVIPNKRLCGTVNAIPSKSVSHRALMLQYLSGGGNIARLGDSDDIRATAQCLDAMKSGGELNARSSATTLRLLIPVLLAQFGGGRIRCDKQLLARPLKPYEDALDAHFVYDDEGVTIKGTFSKCEYALAGDVSSQFVSGIMFALPIVGGGRIELMSRLESKPYADMTRRMIMQSGIDIREYEGAYDVPNGQYMPRDITVDGDWSYAANFYAANALGADIRIDNLSMDSLQGDKVILELVKKNDVDISDCVDIFPALAAAACAKTNPVRLYGGRRLRIKESDRLAAMAEELEKLGARTVQTTDSLTVYGTGTLRGGRVSAHGDHRIAMALAMLGTISQTPIIIEGAECVSKSAPRFFDDIERLYGGKLI